MLFFLGEVFFGSNVRWKVDVDDRLMPTSARRTELDGIIVNCVGWASEIRLGIRDKNPVSDST